ncbi:hypothetical protein HG530_005678 [Fusarium avenaceum]|nr:hypothetical protein HG530_005678 [Fusarium avenaceum]
MPRRKRSQSTVLELPPCEGPKLNIFEHHKSKIQWLERLDDKDENVSSSEGYVFRARIRGREYAVKVFKFFDPMSTEYFWGPMLGEDTPLDTAAYYTDPFYAECRAYGRIRHAKKKGLKAVAVPCHGFLFLRPQEQQALEKQDIDLGLDEIDSDYQRSTIGGLKARAIVKDIASSNTAREKRRKGRHFFVGLNYHLGALGFLPSPEVEKDGNLNVGLLDQGFALKWVEDNIHLFSEEELFPTTKELLIVNIMASETDSIRNTIAYYAIACDDKDWALLDLVFTSDCIVQYPEPLGPINGLQALKETLEKTISHLSTQHALSTQVIRITSDKTAVATTYITASHYLAERSFVSMGKLEDELIKVEEEDEGFGWRIEARTVKIQGIPQGDWSLLQAPEEY